MYEFKCENPKDIIPLLIKSEKLNKKGLYIAGYISYETGVSLIHTGKKTVKYKKPIFYLAAFRKPYVFYGQTGGACTGITPGLSLKPSVEKKEYLKNFLFLKKQILNGEAYQVNYTFQMKGSYKGDLEQLFYALCSRQQTPYTAFINDGDNVVMSFSPELFFKKNRSRITMKPMKGTLLKPCAQTRINEFKKDEKTLAENIMIVDLIRNDLGKICRTGSIKAGSILNVEEYGSLYQMTSTVTGTLLPKIRFRELISALFPCGSVTGAPKIKAMQLISAIEKEPRGVYTGAIGFVSPRFKKAIFNIPIRTIAADIKTRSLAFGTGSGIVYDSKGMDEYKECVGKAEFLRPKAGGKLLIESLLLNNKKYFLLKQHIARLKKSAYFFGINIDLKKVMDKLKAEALRPGNGSLRKVRIIVYTDGHAMVKVRILGKNSRKAKPIAVSLLKTNSNNPMLYHKTADRSLYDSEYKKYKEKGYYDVIFMNEKGELTESHASNIIVKIGEFYYTPPVRCGLLAGTFRAYLMNKRGSMIRERILYLRDLKKADAVYLCNSVRGLRQVQC